jgi:pyruvate formate lyase activating enzyme
MINEMGMIFDLKRFAIFDGPGIRTTVFMKGCPMHCPWCHNPEGISTKKELITYDYKCIICNQCISQCPNQAISTYNNEIKTDFNRCNNCGSCIDICPSTSRQIIGYTLSDKDLLYELDKDRIFFEESSGGVTFSGGEPFQQPSFLKTILINLKKQNIHTCIDTSGYAPPHLFSSILSKTDFLLYDLKIINERLHEKYTGVPNKIIKKNLHIAQEKKIPISIRFALIPEITDTNNNIKELISYLHTLKHINTINLLPYHNVQEKYLRLGKTYTLQDMPTTTKENILQIKERCENIGIRTIIGG